MPKLAWKKTRSIAFPQKRATGASLVEGDLYVHTQPGSGGVQIEDRQGRKVTQVESDRVRIVSGSRVVLGSHEETWLYRVADQEWTLTATLTGKALDFDGSHLVTVENHTLGPDGRCTIRVHRVDDPLQLELELEDQPLWYSAAISDRHLVLFRRTEVHAYELTEGGATRVPFESLPGRGGTGTLGLVGDVCCIDAPGSQNDSVDIYRFADGRWTHQELIDHAKLKNAPYPVMRVGDVGVIRRHELALAVRPHDDGVETKALKSREAYTLFSDGRELGVFSPGSAQLYSLGTTERTRQVPAPAPRPRPSSVPAEWQDRVDALLAHADAQDDIQRRDALAAFRAFVKEVAAAWRSSPDTVAGWIDACDLALEPFPSDLRGAHTDLNPAQPPYRLVRRTLVFREGAEDLGRSAHVRLAHVTGEDLRGTHVKALFQNRDAWTKLETLDLHRCRIGAGALQALAKVPLPRLERLDLLECGVSDAAVRAFAKRGGAPRLEHLCLMAALSKKAQLSTENARGDWEGVGAAVPLARSRALYRGRARRALRWAYRRVDRRSRPSLDHHGSRRAELAESSHEAAQPSRR